MSEASRTIKVYDLGLTNYRDVHLLQQRLQAQRRDGGGVDSLLLTEHRPVVTLGKSHPEPDLRAPLDFLSANRIDVVPTERGGNITYHGPGQLVAYGIIDLRGWQLPVLDYVAGLEAAMIAVLADWGIRGERVDKARGVWVEGRKIASVGLNVRGHVTMHGIALNVDPDLSHFALINPCGMADVQMTSMAREAGAEIPLASVSESFVRHFTEQLDCAAEWVELPLPKTAGMR